MNDDDLKKQWVKITSPIEALRTLNNHWSFLGGDPYYKDLDEALNDLVVRIVAANPQTDVTTSINVGDTLWGHELVRSNDWHPYQIASETKFSWIVGTGRNAYKVNKRTMRSAGRNGFGADQWFTEQGKADYIWRKQHAYRIAGAVQRATADQLRLIAPIVGYDPESTW